MANPIFKVHEVIWTDDKVKQFWTALRTTCMNKLSFSHAMQSYLTELIKAVRTAPATVLDFGSGDGVLVNALIKSGYTAENYDPGSQNYILSEKKFDVVCCFEVLEHILPHQFEKTVIDIKNCLMHEDGIFIGSVPADENLESAVCLCPDCGAVYHRWQHMRAFTRDSLISSLRKSGFIYIYCI